MGQRGAGAGNKSGRHHTHPGGGTSLPSIAPQPSHSASGGSASMLGKSNGLKITPPEQSRGRSPSANGRTDWKAKYLK